jgi:hypothetical protein
MSGRKGVLSEEGDFVPRTCINKCTYIKLRHRIDTFPFERIVLKCPVAF